MIINLDVSIPFIAGQWSLPSRRISSGAATSSFNPLHCGAVVASRRRAPRSRGNSTSFNPLHCGAVVASRSRDARRGTAPTGFNPLHCGAVVASERTLVGALQRALRFNPLHCGAVVASRGGRKSAPARKPVSIPFIAGQWSLRPAPEGAGRYLRRGFQSPSLRGSGRFLMRFIGPFDLLMVSIPFIAGQWSLPDHHIPLARDDLRFQSPSLRGSGRFTP